MKYKWRCIIGATLLTPIVLALIVGVCVFILWVLEDIWVSGIIGVIIFITCLMLLWIWLGFFEHCNKYWSKRESVERNLSQKEIKKKMKCPDCKLKPKVTATSNTDFSKKQTLLCRNCGRRWIRTEDYMANVIRIEIYHPLGLDKHEKARWYAENNKSIQFDLPELP